VATGLISKSQGGGGGVNVGRDNRTHEQDQVTAAVAVKEWVNRLKLHVDQSCFDENG